MIRKREIVYKKSILKLDPRTIFVIFLIAMSTYLQSSSALFINLFVVLGFFLLMLSGEVKLALKWIILMVAFFIISRLVSFGPPMLVSMWAILTISLQFMLPVVAYVLLLMKSTSVEDISTVLNKFRTPQFLAIPILVAIRFIPTIGEEYKYIRNAMVFRGIAIGPKNILRHPLKTMEYIYVPLLFSLVRIGEELTMSSLTRGLGLYKKHTVIREMRLKFFDYMVIAVYGVLYYLSRR